MIFTYILSVTIIYMVTYYKISFIYMIHVKILFTWKRYANY